jgi:hypothetical protein
VSGERQAARILHRDIETVWDRLRAEFVLHDGFWLAFLFGAQAPDIAELVVRTHDQARAQVKHVLALPAGSLPLVRDTAPDLWSVRSLTVTLDTAASATTAAPAPSEVPSPGHSGFTPVPGEPSPTALRDLSVSLNKVAGIQQQRGQLDDEDFSGPGGS